MLGVPTEKSIETSIKRISEVSSSDNTRSYMGQGWHFTRTWSYISMKQEMLNHHLKTDSFLTLHIRSAI